MKKIVLCGISLLAPVLAASAQDLIVRRDSVRHEARVMEIRPGEVRYKRFSNPDGPLYVLPTDAIAYIRYANGEVDRFALPADAKAPVSDRAGSGQAQNLPGVPQPVDPVRGDDSPGPVAEAHRPVENRTYAIGDYYDRDGVQGIVCQVSEDGRSGLVISLDQASLAWCRERNPGYLTGAASKADGAANMEAMARFIADKGLAWEDFPAFAWCRSKGEGWYLPAVDEWLQIGFNYNGGTRMSKQRSARNLFNDALEANGGRKMDRMAYYFTSTESSAAKAYLSHLALDPPYVTELPKHSHWLVRAVHRF